MSGGMSRECTVVCRVCAFLESNRVALYSSVHFRSQPQHPAFITVHTTSHDDPTLTCTQTFLPPHTSSPSANDGCIVREEKACCPTLLYANAPSVPSGSSSQGVQQVDHDLPAIVQIIQFHA